MAVYDFRALNVTLGLCILFLGSVCVFGALYVTYGHCWRLMGFECDFGGLYVTICFLCDFC